MRCGELAGGKVALGVAPAQEHEAVVADEQLDVFGQAGRQGQPGVVGNGVRGGTAAQGGVAGGFEGGKFLLEGASAFHEMFPAAQAAPGGVEKARHIVAQAVAHIQRDVAGGPVAALGHGDGGGAEIGRPAPAVFLQGKGVGAGGAHAVEA